MLGLCFAACALLLAGLPPLAGFLAKFAMLVGGARLGRPRRRRHRADRAVVFTALVIFSGLAALIALVARRHPRLLGQRGGAAARPAHRDRARSSCCSALTVAMTVKAGPVMRYMEATASALDHPHVYIQGVLGTAAARAAEAER